MSERFIAGEGTRVLSRKPTPEMAWVIANMPDAVYPANLDVCASSPGNFIGSQVAALTKEKNVWELTQAGLSIPKAVMRPIEVMRNVPLSMYIEGVDIFLPIEMVAEEVIYKRVGVRLGVIPRGPLAGLLVRPEDARFAKSGMYINRIWNDDIAYEETLYPPKDFKVPAEEQRPAGSLIMLAERPDQVSKRRVMTNLLLNFHSAYEQTVRQIGDELDRDPLESEVFFRLCRELSIYVDEAAFHTTRSNID